MPPIIMTAEFSLFPDNTVLGPSFVLAGYAFDDLGASRSFVNESGSEKGLQFDRAGVRVKLPATTDAVRVRGAAFGGDYQIFGKDGAGSILAAQRIPGDHAPHTVQLAHPGLRFVELVDGGNEGLLEAISITVCKDGAAALSGGAAFESQTLIGRVTGLDVLARAGAIPAAFAFITPEEGDEIQVRSSSPLLVSALCTASATDDRVEASYVIEDGLRVLTRLRLLDR